MTLFSDVWRKARPSAAPIAILILIFHGSGSVPTADTHKFIMPLVKLFQESCALKSMEFTVVIVTEKEDRRDVMSVFTVFLLLKR